MIVLMNVRSFQDETRPNSRIDTIASNNGYGRNNQWLNDTDGLTHFHTPNLEMLSHLKSVYPPYLLQ